MILLPSGERSGDIHVPSRVSKSSWRVGFSGSPLASLAIAAAGLRSRTAATKIRTAIRMHLRPSAMRRIAIAKQSLACDERDLFAADHDHRGSARWFERISVPDHEVGSRAGTKRAHAWRQADDLSGARRDRP